MAQVTETVFKEKMAAFTAALTDAMADDTDNGMASEISDARHPLRQIEKLFIFDPALGTVKANTPYIDAAYAGKYLSIETGFDQIADPPA